MKVERNGWGLEVVLDSGATFSYEPDLSVKDAEETLAAAQALLDFLVEESATTWTVSDVCDVSLGCGGGVRVQEIGHDLTISVNEAEELAGALLKAAKKAKK
jgi:hypothetical protein